MVLNAERLVVLVVPPLLGADGAGVGVGVGAGVGLPIGLPERENASAIALSRSSRRKYWREAGSHACDAESLRMAPTWSAVKRGFTCLINTPAAVPNGAE